MADKVNELLAQASELPYGEARTVLTEEALGHAEAFGDEALTLWVRLQLTSAYQYGGETGKTFTTFSRCLADFDRLGPQVFRGADHHVLWQFKWIVGSLTRFPEVPLDRTYAVLDDMERRYRDNGYGPHAVYMSREKVARHLGDEEAAARWYALWHAAARDELSDCEGCDPTAKVAHLAWLGRDDEAVAVAAPVLDQRLACREQPQAILTELLPVYLRTGHHDKARDAHRTAYRAIRTELADLESIGDHIEFCALTGNEARGLEIVERHLHWLAKAPNPYAGMRFAAASALLLRRVTEVGLRDATVAGRPVEEVRAELAAHATGLASRFDARNGTSRQGDLVRATLAAEPLVDHLPLTPHARRPAAPVVAPPTPPAVDDPDALLDAADEHWERREGAAAIAAWARFDEIGGADTPLRAARRADGAGLERLLAGDVDGAIAGWRDAADRFAALGDEERRQAALGRVGMLMLRERGDESGLAMVESASEYLAEHARSPRRRVAALVRLATARIETGRPEDALAVLDRAGDEPDADMERAHAYADLGDREQAVAALRRACDGYRAAGPPMLLAEGLLRLGVLLAEDEQDETAVEVFTEAIGVCPAGEESLRLAGHAYRGGWLLARDRSAEAVEDLIEAVAGFTAVGAHPQAAYARRDLCAAYYNVGRHLEAAEAAEEAIALFQRLGDADAANSCRFVLAHAQRQLGEAEPAAETFTALAEAEIEHSPGPAAGLLERAGQLLSGADKDLLAAERYAAAADLYRRVEAPLAAVGAQRRHAMCVFYAGRPDDALQGLDRAREELAGCSEPGDEQQIAWEKAALSFDEARVLAAIGRFDEAIVRAEEARLTFARLDAADAVTATGKLIADIREAAAEGE